MGSKPSRHDTEPSEPLTKETIAELCEDTGFTEDELHRWHTNFYKDCPDGKLTLKQFEHEYAAIMGKPTQRTSDYVKHMFNIYDQDKNQFIDFKEFVMALSAASVVNRLRLVETIFHIFDLDNDGRITKDEIGKMLHTLVDVTNSNRKRREQLHHHHHHHYNDQKLDMNLQKRIDDAFNELNTNDDDHITKDEFIEWYMKSGLLSDVQSNEINVPDTSRIQQLDKKSRKIRKQHLKLTNSSNNNSEAIPSRQQLVRHMSHMTEQKAPTIIDDNDEEVIENNSTERERANSDDNDSHYSKENERWQHLFNSVLGQIRAQRFQEEEQQPTTTTNGHQKRNNFHSWKSEGEEKLKVEYFKQKSNDERRSSNISSSNTISNDYPTSPDVVTVRL